MHISTQFKKITVPVDENGLVPSLEEMTAPFPISIDMGGVRSIDIMHDLA